MIRSSICTGEKVAGFKNLETGKFEEIMVIRDEKDYRSFLETYHISKEDVTTEY
ncbi:MAG: aspartate dehydrogenase [Fusicatenibacter sp.]